MNTLNFLKFSENILTSGQPERQEFKDIQSLGVDTVINLAMASADNAIADEGDIVTELDMLYIHMPIPWEAPKPEHFDVFRNTLSTLQEKKLWLHCALNMRVSAFMYLYAVCELAIDEPTASENLHRIWQPNDIWQTYINDIIGNR